MPKRGRGRPIIESITASQQRLLIAIESHIEHEGKSPTLRELAVRLEQGVASIYKLIQRLERNGYLSRTVGKSRGLVVLRSSTEPTTAGMVSIPLLGTVAAGLPIFAPENHLGELMVDAATVRSGRHFALKVSGESMIDAGIAPGDVLIVRQQPLAEHRDMGVALLKDDVEECWFCDHKAPSRASFSILTATFATAIQQPTETLLSGSHTKSGQLVMLISG